MTPQQLMDLPYAGMAEKELRKAGMWRATITDDDRIDWLEDKTLTVQDQHQSHTIIEPSVGDWYGEGLRGLIDDASSTYFMETEQ